MTFMLRDRPDGQVEIIVERPVLVGIFPERETAEKIRAFLQAEDDELPEDSPADSRSVTQAVAEAEDVEALDAIEFSDRVDENVVSVTRAPRPKRKARPVENLPAVVERPQAPVMFVHTPPVTLTAAQIADAFRRLEEGDKLTVVAHDLGISMNRMRGMWAHSRRTLQTHLAEGGQQPCTLCKKPFIPSISHPDTCARCSHA